MTRAWLLGSTALLIIPFACGEDETTSATTTTGSAPTTNASTATSASTGSISGGGGETGSGGMAQGGAGQGGGSGMSCEDCADGVENGTCQNEFDACMASTTMQPSECELWWDCYVDKCMNGEMGGEFTAACFAQCDMDFGGQANLYGPMKTCICNECASECVPFCP